MSTDPRPADASQYLTTTIALLASTTLLVIAAVHLISDPGNLDAWSLLAKSLHSTVVLACRLMRMHHRRHGEPDPPPADRQPGQPPTPHPGPPRRLWPSPDQFQQPSAYPDGMEGVGWFQPTPEDERMLRETGRPDESASDTLRRALRHLDHELWLERFHADGRALRGEDFGVEPEDW